MLVNAFEKALARNFNDDRAFSHVIVRDRLLAKTLRLSAQMDDPEKLNVRTAYKGFLTKNLTGSRCQENQILKDHLPGYIGEVNEYLPEKPLTYEDVVASDVKGTAKIVPYWRSANAVRLMKEFSVAVQFGKPAADATKDELERRVGPFLESLNSWEPSGDESELEVFNEKCVLFRSIIERLPNGDVKKNVARHYLSFLNKSPIQKTNFLEWYFYVQKFFIGNDELFKELIEQVPNSNFKLMSDLKKNLS